MRLTKSLAVVVIAACTTIALAAGAARASQVTQQSGQLAHVSLSGSPGKTEILRFRDGMVARASWLPANSPRLPKLPHGERYAPVVLQMQEISPPAKPILAPKLSAPRSGMIPFSASGCTPAVTFGNQTCIYVNGSGLKVNYWTTGVNLKSPPSSPVALYLINGQVREDNSFPNTDASGFQIDPFGYESTYLFYISGSPEPLIFGNNTKVCNEWNNAAIHSEPCETVHS